MVKGAFQDSAKVAWNKASKTKGRLMSSERESLEQALRGKAEAAIQKLLDALPDKAEITMSDMERLTGEMGRELMQATMQSLSQRQPVESNGVRCEACNIAMQKRGKRKKQVVTLRGEIEVERQYYVCPCCGAGTFPPR
jgi:hypothetical protein